jgi:hypothetical protein
MGEKKTRGRPKIPRRHLEKKNRGRPKKEIKEENYITCENTMQANNNSCLYISTIIDGHNVLVNPLNNDIFSEIGTYIGNHAILTSVE